MILIVGYIIRLHDTGGGVALWLERWSMTGELSHEVQLTGDLFRVNRPRYVSQHGQFSHLSSWGR